MKYNYTLWFMACFLTDYGISTITNFYFWHWQFWMLATPIFVGFIIGREWDNPPSIN